MATVKIETMTPVHIGSGEFLHNNLDFICGKDEAGDKWLYVIDDRKMLELIGVKHLNDWMAAVERQQSIKELMQRYAPNAIPEDYCKRQIWVYNTPADKDTLKECIHDGRGTAYIPGSSIKGAIRTAVVAEEVPNAYVPVSAVGQDIVKGKLSASKVEQRLFANRNKPNLDPQTDIFRFVQVGDAFFPDSEVDFKMINLNIREKQPIMDKTKSQFIEAIDVGNESSFTLNLKTDTLDFVKRKDPNAAGSLPAAMKSPEALFRLVNRHTVSLLQSEMDIWKDYENDDELVVTYRENLDKLLQQTKDCGAKSCILRIGHGSGWRFITGAWAENADDSVYNTIVGKARPGNYKYTQYDFPKTRRLALKGALLGFVKLTL